MKGGQEEEGKGGEANISPLMYIIYKFSYQRLLSNLY
jgi:hypothetical protein